MQNKINKLKPQFEAAKNNNQIKQLHSNSIAMGLTKKIKKQSEQKQHAILAKLGKR